MEAINLMTKHHLVFNPQRHDLHRLVATQENCQTAAMGGRILECANCGTRIVKYHSCNTRGCRRCGPARQARWREKTNRKLLPTGHFHQVFKAPVELHPIWRLDKDRFIGAMFRAVQRAYQIEMEQTGLKLGILMTFQSHGELLCTQLHIHCLVTMGGVSGNGNWIAIRKLNEKRLEKNYQKSFWEVLRKRYDPDEYELIKMCCKGEGTEKLKLHTSYHRRNGERIVNYLSRSLFGLIVLEKDVEYDAENQLALIHNRKKGTVTRMDEEVFMRRYFEHIPVKGEVLIRYYGLYSNRSKTELEEIRAKEFGEKLKEEPEYEEECPECRGTLLLIEEFDKKEIPLLLRLRMNKGSPIGHGEKLPA